MSSSKNRLENQSAFVLHSYPFRETSLILEVFSRNQGRLALVARGARRPRSALRGLLMPFQPLELSWFGKHELRTLHSAEWQGGQPLLSGTALLCGFYLNELLLNLLIRDDPHEQLFDIYRHTLLQLAQGGDLAAVLRCFEMRLLQELGYALSLDSEAGSNQPIKSGKTYRYVVESGAVLDDGATMGILVAGKTLLDMAASDFSDAVSAQQSKLLLRSLLNHHLAGRTLHTRELIKDLQKL